MRYAVIIPVHPPKVSFLIGLLNSMCLYKSNKDKCIDIYLIMTNDSERAVFENAIQFLPFYMKSTIFIISLEKIISDNKEKFPKIDFAYKNNSFNGIINLKKLVALWSIKGRYDGYSIIDSDCIFVGDIFDVFQDLDRNFNKKILIGNERKEFEMPVVKTIQQDVESVVRYTSDKDILSFSGWFFEPPYYRNDILNDYFDFICTGYENLDHFLSSLRWGSFEDFFRQDFLILRCGFKRVYISQELGHDIPCEFLPPDDREKIYLLCGIKPIWLSFDHFVRPWLHNPSQISHYKMILHVDRI